MMCLLARCGASALYHPQLAAYCASNAVRTRKTTFLLDSRGRHFVRALGCVTHFIECALQISSRLCVIQPHALPWPN